jgi:hypothetical protein
MDGLTIARHKIAQEAEDRTGFLDLGRLGLTELPDANAFAAPQSGSVFS